jgi:uncharacterized protein DUF6894
MPRYYFHLDGDDDDNGSELPDDATARQQAQETFGAMIREGAVSGSALMEVMDGTGRRVVSLKFLTEL